MDLSLSVRGNEARLPCTMQWRPSQRHRRLILHGHRCVRSHARRVKRTPGGKLRCLDTRRGFVFCCLERTWGNRPSPLKSFVSCSWVERSSSSVSSSSVSSSSVSSSSVSSSSVSSSSVSSSSVSSSSVSSSSVSSSSVSSSSVSSSSVSSSSVSSSLYFSWRFWLAWWVVDPSHSQHRGVRRGVWWTRWEESGGSGG